MRRYTMLRFWTRLAVLMTLAVTLLLLVGRAAGRGLERRTIAYISSTTDGSHRVFLMDINRALTIQFSDILAGTSCCLSWSPDGSTLAFLGRDDSGITYLHLIDADGRNARRLTLQDEWRDQSNPHWSPDGSTVAFTAFRGSTRRAILLADRYNGALRQVVAEQVYNNSPFWSPDGGRLVLAGNIQDERYYQIITVNPDGSDLQQLTSGAWDDTAPEFSPDGKQILFVSNRIAIARQQIYVIDADGGEPTRLTNTRTHEYDPHWSPDGSRIVFTSRRDGSAEIFVMNADGGDQRRLTETEYDSRSAAWSPDGRQILFLSDRDGDLDLYLINSDGTDERRLTSNTWADNFAVWQP